MTCKEDTYKTVKWEKKANAKFMKVKCIALKSRGAEEK